MPSSNSSIIEPDFRRERFRFLKNKIQLDLLSVDEALEEIATLVQDAGECVALANEIRDAAKNELAVAEAEEADRLRQTTTIKGKPPSDYAIPSMLHLCESVRKASQVYSDARLDAALWATIVNGLMTKSSAIRTAADLISSGYLTTNHIYSKRRQEIRDVSPSVMGK
jgi:hypothetical protein